MANRKLKPIHPGEILLEEFLKPLLLSQYRLALDIGVSPRRINEIIHGSRAISADTALRLGVYFKTSALFWMNLQMKYDLEVEKDKAEVHLKKIKVFRFQKSVYKGKLFEGDLKSLVESLK